MDNQEQQHKVSVLIGVYNVEKFLKKELSCVLNQTYRNIEVILVDDGSTDTSGELCDQLAIKDSRIIVIHKVNGGLGSARNAGLDAATGEYICFYDVDDEIEPDLVEKNVTIMQKTNAEVVIFGMFVHTPSLKLEDRISFKEHLITNNEELKASFVTELLLVPHGNGFVCNKFYNRSFLEKNKFRFGYQLIQQDEVFNIQIYPVLERVFISSEILYHYYIYSTGNNRSRFIKDRFEIFVSIFDHLFNFNHNWGLNDDRMINYIYNRFYHGIANTIFYNCFHKDAPYTIMQRGNEIRRILMHPKSKECISYISKNNNFKLENKIYLFLFQGKSVFGITFFRFLFNSLRFFKKILIDL